VRSSATQNVCVAFGPACDHVVLEDVSLEICPNEILGILGPSGCGKSTLLRVMIGLLPPTRGARPRAWEAGWSACTREWRWSFRISVSFRGSP